MTYFLIEIGEKDMEVSLFYLIHPTYSTSCTKFGYSYEISVLFVEFSTRCRCMLAQAKQSKQLLTKKNRLLSEATTYIFFHRNG